jgi:hypothetical protein
VRARRGQQRACAVRAPARGRKADDVTCRAPKEGAEEEEGGTNADAVVDDEDEAAISRTAAAAVRRPTETIIVTA